MTTPEVTRSNDIAGESTRTLGKLCVMKDDSRATLPLSGVRMTARVADLVAEVSVHQKFRNPFAEALEAVYIFPLGGGAAVSAFEMRVGDRVIRGVCKERGKAREEYAEAVREGKRASLLEQDRDDVFTMQVGNLPPGEEIDVRIVYSERLPWFEEGHTELRLPLVVAPRYIPGEPLPRDPAGDGVEWDTDQVPDASRITPPRLAPGVDPAVALQIEVELLGGLPADLACSQHAVRLSGGKIALARQDELLDRDFVLRWSPAEKELGAKLLVHRDGTGMLTLIAPKGEASSGAGRDVVFILDRSGSMAGIKLTSSSRACSLLLATLGPRDRFAIVAFDNAREWFSNRELMAADEGGIARGREFLRKIQARGGTDLAPALEETLDLIAPSKDPERQPVVVVLTDGQVGNESACLKLIQKRGKHARLFTIGIDTAVNRAFLDRVASLGRGTCSCVVPGESLEEALRSVAREVGDPLVTDLTIEGAADIAPSSLPDLFRGRAAAVYLRPTGNRITVRGKKAGGRPFEETVTVKEVDLPAVTHLWARARIADLEDAYRMEPSRQEALSKEIIEISVRHTVLSRFTAFLAVDEKEAVIDGGQVRRVVQPVHVPAGWVAPATMDYMCAPRSSSGIRELRFEHPVMSFREARNEDEASSPAKTPNLGVGGAMALREYLKETLEAASAGRLPDATRMEQIRKLLKSMLEGRTRVPRAIFEKIVRAFSEILDALAGAGITAGAVQALLEPCLRELEAASGKKDFWKGSV